MHPRDNHTKKPNSPTRNALSLSNLNANVDRGWQRQQNPSPKPRFNSRHRWNEGSQQLLDEMQSTSLREVDSSHQEARFPCKRNRSQNDSSSHQTFSENIDRGWRRQQNPSPSKPRFNSRHRWNEGSQQLLGEMQSTSWREVDSSRQEDRFPRKRNRSQNDSSSHQTFSENRHQSPYCSPHHPFRGQQKQNGNPVLQGSNHNQSNQQHRHRRNTRLNPIGYRALQILLTTPPNEIVLELLRENSGYPLLLQESQIRPDLLILLVKVLARATNTNSNRENLMDLLTSTLCPNIQNILIVYILQFQDNNLESVEFFNSLGNICQTFLEVRPYVAISKIKFIVETGFRTLHFKKSPLLTQSEKIYEGLKNSIENIEGELKERQANTHREPCFVSADTLEPPDNFRDLSVLPDIRDIDQSERPFLRKNIIRGKYEDADHYLDVQFRLLREDFVRPIRDGIAQYRSNATKRNQNLRIYQNVYFSYSSLMSKELIYYLKIQFPKNFRSENSKNLLYGNLICLSSDGFRTLIFGYVFDRKIETLKEGHIGVKLEINKDLPQLSVKYVMAESRSYFVAYKHVLQALKEIQSEKLPFPHYLVELDQNIHHPDYVTHQTRFNLSTVTVTGTVNNNLCRVPLITPLVTWPNAHEMRLDNSQHRALYGALTRDLSIIQGPPGTGKTFLGLKIAEILLNNYKVNFEVPIMVICYTNHALDQFLEGISHFTNKIVRVGSRTKSEIIDKFNINLLIKNSHFPQNIFDLKNDLTHQNRCLENNIQQLLCEIKTISNPEGILKLDYLQDSIPSWAFDQFYSDNPTLVNWLLEPSNIASFGQNAPDLVPDSFEGVEEEHIEEEWHDAIELMEQAEADREILLNDVNLAPRFDYKFSNYEITIGEIVNWITELKSALLEDPTNFQIMHGIDICQMQKEILTYGLKAQPYDFKNSPKHVNLFTLDINTRWSLYNTWLAELKKKKTSNVQNLAARFQVSSKQFSELKDQQYLHVMRKSQVMGLTTTGAARLNSVIKDLAPQVVIIEEAAEILEAHVVASLTSSCQQLILIGDHQQLKPSTTVYELAKKFNLETSLFERLIRNGVAFDTLEYQHRMRPAISSLIVPSIYEKLKDHPSVSNYPKIKGVTKDVFFINHKEFERSESDDNNSHENIHEAHFIIAFSRYLVLQGYEPSQITILTPYSGQFFLLRKIQRSDPVCYAVKICVVDNFQGEENDIILLSLVRSNIEGSVGFLKTENRVCVALSRAKQGLYIIGNMAQLCQSSDLWKKIHQTLTEQDCIGNSLELRCEVHQNSYMVATGEDILNKSPEGGCKLECGVILPCDHTCHRTCHIRDRDHKELPCESPCSKIICDYGHQCPKRCSQQCGKCMVPMDRYLPCGHTTTIPCYVDPNDYYCKVQVEKILPDCQHENILDCSADVKKQKCSYACDTRLDCGHQCKQTCHVNNDPDHDNYDCREPCALLNKGCSSNHQCLKLCYENCGKCIVLVTKKLPCGHRYSGVACHQDITCHHKCQKKLECGHICPMKCADDCGNCEATVVKKIPGCNHEAKVKCSKDPSLLDCSGPCIKLLPCGHKCKEHCNKVCTSKCKELVVTSKMCPKGHALSVPCHLNKISDEDRMWMFCKEKCNTRLSCDHTCKGTCGDCLHGRLHIPCQEKCEKTLVCGHVCNAACSDVCPPCGKPCPLKCNHNICKRKCGIPCMPCKAKKCRASCKHRTCLKMCGSKCSVDPCKEPCPNKLKCGHDCVGFCGEPCPKECRTCDNDKLTEVFFGSEDEEKARFVKLVDCGHVFESEGLDHWMTVSSEDAEEIGMKKCPRCQIPIYNSLRYKNVILDAYHNIEKVKQKYFSTNLSEELKKNITQELADVALFERYREERKNIMKNSCTDPTMSKKARKRLVPDMHLYVCLFKAQILKRVAELEKNLHGDLKEVQFLLDFIVKRMKKIDQKITPQISEEFSCELRRIGLIPSITKLKRNCQYGNDIKIYQQIKVMMDATIKMDQELEEKIRGLLKKTGQLGLPPEEKRMIVTAMGFQQGHWYKCPKGHIYCIGECGGAISESTCPECGSKIGGSSHQLRADNRVATEMDGASQPAYPYNHM